VNHKVQNLVDSIVIIKINNTPTTIQAKKQIELFIPKRAKVQFPKGTLEITPIDLKSESDAVARKEMKLKEEADKKAKEEADKKAKEEADKKAKEEADKKAKVNKRKTSTKKEVKIETEDSSDSK